MKNKKVLIAIIAVVAIVLVVALILGLVIANGNKPEKLILGTWQGKTNDGLDTAFTFEKDGKIKYNNAFGFDSEGTYEFKSDDEISIKIESWDEAKTYKFDFKDKKNLSLEATDKLSPSYKELKKVDEYKFEDAE